MATLAVARLPWLLSVPAPDRKQDSFFTLLTAVSVTVQLVESIVTVEDPSITTAENLTEPNDDPPVTAGLEPAAPASIRPANTAGTATTVKIRVDNFNSASSGGWGGWVAVLESGGGLLAALDVGTRVPDLDR